ncbi:MAG: outer membrane beta-barrel protein [Alphaproteobacteria bacterium]|nr:outer membrane beta-barrel protein [Alphaproteobacteria bacterium]
MTRIKSPALQAAVTLAAAALAPLAGPTAAQAADSPWYLGFQVPVMLFDDPESGITGRGVTSAGPPPVVTSYSAKATSEYKAGFKIAGMVGYRLGGNLRVEGELFIARAKVDKQYYSNVTFGGQGGLGKLPISVTGSTSQAGAMANLWLDIPIGSDWTPYVGGGVGFIRVDQGDLEYDANALAQAAVDQLTGQPGTPLPPGFVPELSSTDTSFGYHFGFGVSYRLNDRATLQLGYRLQIAGNLEFKGRNAQGAIDGKTEMRAHLFEIGVRMRF